MLQDVLKKGQGKGEISLLGNVGAGVKIFVPHSRESLFSSVVCPLNHL